MHIEVSVRSTSVSGPYIDSYHEAKNKVEK